MPDELGVETAPPAATTEVNPEAQVTSPQPETAQADRPVENLKGEFDRKFTKLQSQLDQAIQLIVQGQQVRQTPPIEKGVLSDEELWASAQQGDRTAFEEYQRRIADRQVDQRLATNRRTDLVTTQLQVLVNRYPALNDGNHPLTMKTQQAYQALVQNGYAVGPATLLEAAKTAIADSPDIVSDLYTRSAQTREQGRQSATARAQGGVMGAQSRSTPAPRGNDQSKAITPEDRALAKRMGITTDEKIKQAKARFLQRNAEGTSNLGAVGGYVNTEDL